MANNLILLMNTAHFIILTNILGVEEIGALAGVLIIVFAAATLANFSLPLMIPTNVPLPAPVVKFIPQFLGRGERGKAARVFRLSVMVSTVISLAIAAGIVLGATEVSRFLFRGVLTLPQVGVVALDTMLFTLGQLLMGALIGSDRAARAGIYVSVAFALRYIVAAGSVLLGYGLWGVLIAYLLGDGLLLALSAATLRPLIAEKGDHFPVGQFFDYANPLLVSSLIIFGVAQMDKIFTFLQLGLSKLAIYNVAVVASTIGSFAPSALTTALVPSLSAHDAKGDREGFLTMSKLYTRYVSLLSFPTAFGVASAGIGLVQIFGRQYQPAALPAAIMSVGVGLTAFTAVYNGQLLAVKATREVMYANVAGLATLIATLAVLIPLMDYIGAAWSRLAMTLVVGLILIYLVRRRGLFTLDRAGYLAGLVAATVMGVVVFAVLSNVGGYREQLAALPGVVLGGALIYLIALRAMRAYREEDIAFLESLLPARLRWAARLAGRVAGVH
jgi:O-antigen/teichoic acid export membrane protein